MVDRLLCFLVVGDRSAQAWILIIEFLLQRSKAKLKQTRTTFDTQLKTTLIISFLVIIGNRPS